MTTAEIEDRLKVVEQEVAQLKARVFIPPTSPNHWIEEIAGTFSCPQDRAAFDEAMRLGRKWRKSFRPKTTKSKMKRK